MTRPAQIAFSRKVEVRHEVDVFVAGGGPAGVAAAVTAARQGKSVFLAEGQGCFGGVGTSGGLPIFALLTDGVNFLAGGVGREVHDRLHKAGGLGPTPPPDRLEWTVYRIETLKRVYDEMVGSSGASFSFMTHVVGIEREADRVTSAILWGKSGLFAVKAGVFVDCTGDGDLCAWAGADFEKGDPQGRMQPPTLCSLWTEIDWEAVNASGFGMWRQEEHLPRAFAEKIFTVEDPHLPGMFPAGPRTGRGNIGHAFGVDGTDERSLTRGLVWSRKLMIEYERFYKTCLKGYEKMELASTAAVLGVRETRRILGDYVLNVEDFRRRATFPDEIGRYAYPVDVHASEPGEEGFRKLYEDYNSLRYGPGESYGIPYRCLTPRGLANVLVAGRCISADRRIQGSIRVMPACFITGQAAGLAAALAAEHRCDSRAIDVSDLRGRLKSAGGYLPDPLS